MTSKEALNKMIEKYDWVGKEYCRLIGKNESLHKVNQEAFENLANIIKQDLERLEKLERMFEIMQRHFYVCRGFMESRITTEKNFKECLKNSWTKYYNGMPVIDKDYDELYNLWNEVLEND